MNVARRTERAAENVEESRAHRAGGGEETERTPLLNGIEPPVDGEAEPEKKKDDAEIRDAARDAAEVDVAGAGNEVELSLLSPDNRTSRVKISVK